MKFSSTEEKLLIFKRTKLALFQPKPAYFYATQLEDIHAQLNKINGMVNSSQTTETHVILCQIKAPIWTKKHPKNQSFDRNLDNVSYFKKKAKIFITTIVIKSTINAPFINQSL